MMASEAPPKVRMEEIEPPEEPCTFGLTLSFFQCFTNSLIIVYQSLTFYLLLPIAYG